MLRPGRKRGPNWKVSLRFSNSLAAPDANEAMLARPFPSHSAWQNRRSGTTSASVLQNADCAIGVPPIPEACAARESATPNFRKGHNLAPKLGGPFCIGPDAPADRRKSRISPARYTFFPKSDKSATLPLPRLRHWPILPWRVRHVLCFRGPQQFEADNF